MSMFQRLALAAFVPLCLAPIPAFAAQPFDGQWSVEVVTEKGTCDGYRWDVTVSDGRIAAGAGMPAGADGTISPAGRVSANFTRGADRVVANGSASGKWASGQWVASSLNCSGRWRAEHRA